MFPHDENEEQPFHWSHRSEMHKSADLDGILLISLGVFPHIFPLLDKNGSEEEKDSFTKWLLWTLFLM